MPAFQLAHTVDVESQRLGLQAWEVVQLLEAAIERQYLRDGRLVHVTIDTSSLTAPIIAVEARDLPGGTLWEPVQEIRQPSFTTFQREVEAYVRSKDQQKRWWLAECQVLSVEFDHYLVELVNSDEEGLVGQTAVLPLRRTSQRNEPLTKGVRVWAVITQKNKAKIDGGEQWHSVDCSFLASRTDSIFLRMLIKQYWRIDARADISNGAGLVIAPQEYEIGSIIGPNGRHIAMLKMLSGLSRIVVARDVSGKRPDLRLSSAIRQITNLSNVRVRPPKKDSDEWRLLVRNKDAKVLIGTNGVNLRFISSLAGLKIQHLVRDGQ